MKLAKTMLEVLAVAFLCAEVVKPNCRRLPRSKKPRPKNLWRKRRKQIKKRPSFWQKSRIDLPSTISKEQKAKRIIVKPAPVLPPAPAPTAAPAALATKAAATTDD